MGSRKTPGVASGFLAPPNAELVSVPNGKPAAPLVSGQSLLRKKVKLPFSRPIESSR